MAVTFTTSTYLSTTSVPAGLNQNSAALTMSIWVYVTAQGGSGTFASDGNIGNYIAVTSNTAPFADFSSLLNYSGAGIGIDWNQSVSNFAEEAEVTGSGVGNNAWRHVAVTFNASATKVYVQGTLSASGSGTVPTAKPWERFVIGPFAGDAQDAIIYNRVLSAAEIQQLYRRRHIAIDRTGLVGHWPLPSGGSATADWSGNGRTLTATGSVPDASRTAPVGWNRPIPAPALRYR